MSNALYTSCAEVLSLCQTLKDDLPAILDPETGFAPRLRRVCHEQYVKSCNPTFSHQAKLMLG